MTSISARERGGGIKEFDQSQRGWRKLLPFPAAPSKLKSLHFLTESLTHSTAVKRRAPSLLTGVQNTIMYQEKKVANSNSTVATPPQKIRSVNMFHFPARKNNHLWQKHQTELTDDGRSRYRRSRRKEGGGGGGSRERPPSDCIVTLSIGVMPDTCHLAESASEAAAVRSYCGARAQKGPR